MQRCVRDELESNWRRYVDGYNLRQGLLRFRRLQVEKTMKSALRGLFIVLSFFAAAIGGVIFDDHKRLGIILIIIGLAGSIYLWFSSERSQRKTDHFSDTTAKLLSLAGVGNPYTQMIEDDLAKGGTHNHVLDALDKALEIDANDVKALAQYVIISALHISLDNHVSPGSISPHARQFLKTSERIERGLKTSEHRYEFLVAKGILLDEIGKHSEARHWFREVGEIQPFPFPFWRLLTATSFGKDRDYINALRELEHALDEGASGPTFDFYYARALGSVGEYDLAISRLEKVRSVRGNYYQLVDLLRSFHHFAWHPMRSAYFALLSAVYVFRKNKMRSLVHMRDSLLAIGLPVLMSFFNIVEKLARKLPIVRTSKLARLTDPGNPYVSLGMSLIKTGNFLAAQKQFVKASKHSDRLNTWMNLCSASLSVSDWMQAQRAHSYLIERWPEEIPAGYAEAISEGLSYQNGGTRN